MAIRLSLACVDWRLESQCRVRTTMHDEKWHETVPTPKSSAGNRWASQATYRTSATNRVRIGTNY